MARYSIRLRLTWWYSAVLALGLALFAAAMWFALERRLVREVDARLGGRVNGLHTVLEVESPNIRDRNQMRDELSEFTREVPEGDLTELADPAGALLTSKLGASLPGAGEGATLAGAGAQARAPRTVSLGGHRYRLLETRTSYGGVTYQVRVWGSLEAVETVMREFRNLLLLVIPGVLLAAWLGGYWVSRRALEPVDEITRVARRISVRNLSERLAVPQTGDELQRMSQTWNEVLARLEAAVRRIRQFTADASHELRTPVALIRATAELALRRERDAAVYRQALGEILEEAERMTALTEALLEVARSDAAGGGEMPLEPTDVNALARSVVAQSAAAAGERGLVVEARAAGQAALAEANPAALRRLLWILVDNAFRHTPAGGTVTVSTAVDNGSVELAVSDTGEGIPSDALPHIFERFYRADAARARGDGAGLGLAIAQSIARAHESEIQVASRPGAGARFWLRLRV